MSPHEEEPRPEAGSEGRADTANDRFKEAYTDWLAIGLLIAVASHFALVELFPKLRAADVSVNTDEMEAVELPPQVEIPPPPKQIARPATPKVAEANVSEDVTIAPTTFEENPVEKLPPPPKSGSVRDRPSFIPHDVRPQLRNKGEIQSLLQKKYPAMLKDAGIGGRVLLWLFVDENGNVQEVRIKESSGYSAFDNVGAQIAQRMDFKPAINKDKPIGVWISQQLTFRVR